MVSYELALGLSVIGVLMLTGSLSMDKIVEAQKLRALHHLSASGVPDLLIEAFAECAAPHLT